jgi:hypothetical protein
VFQHTGQYYLAAQRRDLAPAQQTFEHVKIALKLRHAEQIEVAVGSDGTQEVKNVLFHPNVLEFILQTQNIALKVVHFKKISVKIRFFVVPEQQKNFGWQNVAWEPHKVAAIL